MLMDTLISTMAEGTRPFMANNKTYINFSLGLLLFAATVALYGHSLWNPLVFDDKPLFVENILKQYGTSLFHLDLRWFSYASFGWTYDLFGLDWFWYRIGNLALHAVNSVLLFLFFQRLLIATAQPQDSTLQTHWPAFFAALIFALHPVAVYGVAYLVERSIILATLFGIAALLCYLEGLNRDKIKWYIASALFYFLAVFSKEHSVMIPGVAAALTLLLHKPSLSLVKKVWLPFALYLGIGLLVVLRSKGVLGSPYEPFAAEMLAHLSEQQQGINIENAYGLSVITEGFLFFKYLLLWIIPYTGWMSVDLRQPFATHLLSWPESAGLILFIVYPLLATKLLLQGGRKGLFGFGMLFPWILYLTEFSAVRIQEPFVLYRSYLWMSGLPVVLLSLLGTAPRKLVSIALPVLCLIVAALAWNRLDTFSGSLKLWSDVISKNQNEKLLGVERGYNNRGSAYLESGQLQKAQEDFTKSLALNPRYPDAHLNIGIINFRQKHLEEALQSYNTAIELRPDYVDAYVNRGVLFLQTGRHAGALSDFEHVLQLNPQNADAYLNRGLAYSSLSRTQEALNDLDEAIHLDPKLVAAYINRSALDAMQGHADSALADLDKAARIEPRNASIYYNRGIVHGAMGRFQDALQDYNQAIELDPNYADAYVNRGGLYMIAKRFPEAMAEFDHAIQLNPDQENAYLNRGNVLASQSRYQDALGDYDKALKLNPKNGKALLSRGFVLLALNKKQEAQASFRASCDAGNRQGCEKAH